MTRHTPTLILGGPMSGPHLGAANPHVEFRVVEGAGHSVHRDRPDAVLQSV